MGGCGKLEIVEEIVIAGSRRFRVRIGGTNIIINVSAGTPEEALEKAQRIAERRVEC
ncbi:MAG: hypothetical protein LRS48_05495 [Desulfurococcales archaeon]|nr:hypothetical protein [Desulfurococcales archaeon]